MDKQRQKPLFDLSALDDDAKRLRYERLQWTKVIEEFSPRWAKRYSDTECDTYTVVGLCIAEIRRLRTEMKSLKKSTGQLKATIQTLRQLDLDFRKGEQYEK